MRPSCRPAISPRLALTRWLGADVAVGRGGGKEMLQTLKAAGAVKLSPGGNFPKSVSRHTPSTLVPFNSNKKSGQQEFGAVMKTLLGTPAFHSKSA